MWGLWEGGGAKVSLRTKRTKKYFKGGGVLPSSMQQKNEQMINDSGTNMFLIGPP